MYVKKSDVEYWINYRITNLQRLKNKEYFASLPDEDQYVQGAFTMLYQLELITEERWTALLKQTNEIIYK